MKTTSFGSTNALIALLATRQFFTCDCYSVTLFGGGVLRWTTADVDIAYGGNTFSSKGVRVDQAATKVLYHAKVGLDVDTLSVVLMPRNVDPVTGALYPDKIGSVPFIAAASGGALAGADVQVERAYFAAAPTFPLPAGGAATPTACIVVFAGRMAEVDTTDTVVCLTVNDYRVLLNQQLPKNVYQASCRHTLFDNGCTLTAAAFAVSGVVGAGSARNKILAPALAAPAGSGSYALGKVVMTGGLDSGFSRTVRSWDGTGLALLNPFPFELTAGDTFTAYPGCDKSAAACAAFGNLINFGGQRLVPQAETAV